MLTGHPQCSGGALWPSTLLNAAQIIQERGGGGVTLIWTLGDCARDYSGKRAGDVLERGRIYVNDAGHGGGETVALKGLLAA